MKSAEPSTRTSKSSRGETSIVAPTWGAMPAIEEVHEDPIAVVDPSSDDDIDDPTVTHFLLLRAMMESFMTTQATHGQLIDERLTAVAALRADFAEYRSVFLPPPPFDD